MQPIMLVVGTRPEGIKMMPVYFALKRAGIPVIVCSTGQHCALLEEVFTLFSVIPEVSLSLMKPDQDLSYLTSAVLESMKRVYAEYQPCLVLVEGDTTTVMAAALAAFYEKIPVGHVEAGLRTGDMLSPYPEEANRCIVGLLAQYHFAPTSLAAGNLLAEGKKRDAVFCVGNTVVDALRIIEEKIKTKTVSVRPEILSALQVALDQGQKKVLLTAHRRESFPDGIVRIISAVKQYAQAHPEVAFFYPYHPNPVVMNAVAEARLEEQKNIFLFPPLTYHELVFLLQSADCVMTDSGGIQEEAVSMGKNVLVLREKSERMEGVWEGLATLVGTQENAILEALEKALEGSFTQRSVRNSVYGDGFSADRIVEVIKTFWGKKVDPFTVKLHRTAPRSFEGGGV
jgi:UDP-N-acetylglucosamine 2-epimerase (non-hydrolysing)